MSGRHLRIHYFDAYGQELDRGCTAVTPRFRMPLSRLPAMRYTGPANIQRRELAAVLILRERNRRAPQFHAVLFIVCPDRATAACRSKRHKMRLTPHLVPTNAYLGSFAALSPMNQVVAGDVMTATLARAYNDGLKLVRDVLMRRPGQAPAAMA